MLAFRRAETEAQAAHERGEPWAAQLVVQARMGQGSVCVAAQSWPLGAQTYHERALPAAVAVEDLRMQVEALRMAAYCREQAGDAQAAWDRCVDALAVGNRIPAEERGGTTLAYVGEAMLRLCERRTFRGRERIVDARMCDLLGPRWRPSDAPDDGSPRDVTRPSALETDPPPVRTVPAELATPVRPPETPP
jgi:hypothetical protein